MITPANAQVGRQFYSDRDPDRLFVVTKVKKTGVRMDAITGHKVNVSFHYGAMLTPSEAE